MAKLAKKYKQGGGGKRLIVELEEPDFKNLDIILKDLEQKNGKRAATDTRATTDALRFYAEYLTKGISNE